MSYLAIGFPGSGPGPCGLVSLFVKDPQDHTCLRLLDGRGVPVSRDDFQALAEDGHVTPFAEEVSVSPGFRGLYLKAASAEILRQEGLLKPFSAVVVHQRAGGGLQVGLAPEEDLREIRRGWARTLLKAVRKAELDYVCRKLRNQEEFAENAMMRLDELARFGKFCVLYAAGADNPDQGMRDRFDLAIGLSLTGDSILLGRFYELEIQPLGLSLKEWQDRIDAEQRGLSRAARLEMERLAWETTWRSEIERGQAAPQRTIEDVTREASPGYLEHTTRPVLQHTPPGTQLEDYQIQATTKTRGSGRVPKNGPTTSDLADVVK